MNKRMGALYLVAAVVALGIVSPAVAAGTEEDAAAPQGSFVSTTAAPGNPGNAIHTAQARNGQNQQVVVLTGTEEDAAAPHGSFTSTMAIPEIRGGKIKLASGSLGRDNGAALAEAVAGSLE